MCDGSSSTGRGLLRCLTVTAAVAGCNATGSEPQEHPDSLRDLPLVEFPADMPSPTMALVMSGDGNWAHFIRELADTLVDRGIPVVGLESRSYLSKSRTPEELSRDMERVLRRYLKAWSAEKILVVGYSRGADFAPFLVNRLPPDLRARVQGVALLSPTKMASFEFHLIDLIRYVHRSTDLDAVPEVEALAPIPTLCIYGRKDESALCPDLPVGTAEIVALDAGHRLRDSGKMADLIIHRLERSGSTGSSPADPTSSESPPGSRR